MSGYKFRLRFFPFIVLFFITLTAVQAQSEFTLQEGTVVIPVDGDRAKELLTTEDEYTALLSRFDLMSKTQSKSDTVQLKDYLNKSAASVVKWSDEDKKGLSKVVESVSKKIKELGLKLSMPPRIEIIKSDMSNEGGADGYTRSNYIVMKTSSVSGSSGTYDDLFIHELFHVLSRHDKTMSEKVYNVIGFKKCNEVPYPKEIAALRLTNPDAPFNDFYITVKYENKPVDAMLILFSEREYKGGSFFGYFKIGLLAVEGESMDKKVVYKDGKPLILGLDDVEGFYEQTGKNTDYNLHAEELSADHFVMLLDQKSGLPNPEIIETMKKVMK